MFPLSTLFFFRIAESNGFSKQKEMTMIQIRVCIHFFLLTALLWAIGCDDSGDASDAIDTDSDTSGTDSETESPIPLSGQYVSSITPLSEITADEVSGLFSLMALQVPESGSFSALATYDVAVYKMVYRTAYQQSDIAASALLAVPLTETPVPVISYQNGTNTQYSAAPTEDYNGQLMRVFTSIASMGYAVVIADYIGFGESTQLFHPYLCKDVTVQSLSDMLLAVDELDSMNELTFSLNGDLFLVGYSQGGHATMALHEYLNAQTDYPLVLQATAAGAGPYDLTDINAHILSLAQYEQPYYGPYTVLAFQSMGFISDDLSLYFAADYAAVIPSLYTGQLSSDDINGSLTTNMQELYAPALIDGLYTDTAYETLLTAFEENSVAAIASQTPIRLYHGTADTYVPLDLTTNLVTAFIDAGTPETLIETIEFEGEDHQSAGAPAIIDAVTWFNELSGY